MSRQWLAGAGLAALAALTAWQGALALQNQSAAAPTAAQPISRKAEPTPSPALAQAETPMAQRTAVLGVLNKRNGNWHDITLHPGQGMRVASDLIVRLRACDTTADWEPQKLTGAFVQVDVRGADNHWRRVFSGWLYKESPSLNAVEHPVYDVWTKSCTMSRPETGPDTVSASSLAPARSSAKKSTATASADASDAKAPPATKASSSKTR